ncbi:hypothetical protein FRC04_008238 [Tulasnella sp. 424]|nr:hypothetical protein FRC04_008238 [Tulasnella sp. 424]KAG8959244.1 hypothetical protein FRC05_007976 [Tulasnella sp. 425]
MSPSPSSGKKLDDCINVTPLFDSDWATSEIVKDVLTNRCKYQIKLTGQAPENTNNQEHTPAHSNAELEGRESSVPAGSKGSEGTDDEEVEVDNEDDSSD